MLNSGLGLGMLFFAKDLASDVMDGLERKFHVLEGTSEQASRNMQRHFRSMKMGLAGMVAGGAVLGTIGAIGAASMRAAGQMEMYNVAMDTMLKNQGSSLTADSFLRQLQEFAQETPFDFEGLVEATKMLMAFGFEAEKILPMMRTIGDAVAGLGGGTEGQQRVIRAFGQMQAKGRVMAEELLQLQEIGIPVFQILQEEMGLTAEQVANIGNESVNSAEAIDAILRGLDKRFGGLMEKQAKTVDGMKARIADTMNLLALDIGEGMMGSVKNVLHDVGNLLDAIQDSGAMKAFGQGIGNVITAFRPLLVILSLIVSQISAFVGKYPEIARVITTLVGVGSAILFIGGAFMVMRSAGAIALTMIRAAGLSTITGLGPLLWLIVGITAALTALRIAYRTNFAGFGSLVDSVAQVWKGFWSLVTTARIDGGQLVGDMPQEIRDALERSGLLGWAVGAFKVFTRVRSIFIGVGQAVIGVFRVIGVMLSPIIWTFSLIGKLVGRGVALFSSLTGAIFNLPPTGFWKAIGNIIGVVLGLVLVGSATKATIALLGLAKAAIASGIAFLTTPFGMFVAGLLLVGGVVYSIVRYWDDLKAAIGAAWQWFTDFASNMPGWVAGLLAIFAPIVGIPVLIIRYWEQIVTFFQEIPNKIRGAIDWLTDKFGWLINGVSKVGGFVGRLLGWNSAPEEAVTPSYIGSPAFAGIGGDVAFPAATEVPVSGGPFQGSIIWPATSTQNTAAIMAAYGPAVAPQAPDAAPAAPMYGPLRQPVQLVLDGRVVAETVLGIEDEDERRQGRW